jgi:alkylation response protein AidB-like acyl-CoA dehydrogenase
MPGLTQSKPLRKMGLHSSPTGELFLDNVRVERERLIGETEDLPARSGAKDTFTMERTGVAAMALGIVERCLQLSVEYAKTRVQFGRPIGEFQLIAAKLAEMATDLYAARLMTYDAASLIDREEPVTQAAAMAKLFATEACARIVDEATRIYGSYGFAMEYPVQRYFRDARFLLYGGGTSEILKGLIGREELKRK